MKIKRGKFNNVKVEIDGHTFDSKKEAKRYSELKLLERAGEIKDLRLQVPFELVPSQKGGLRSERPVTYIADFVYYDIRLNKEIINDAKGVITKDYRIKRCMMKMIGKEILEC
jgi:hypothetical protein